MVRVRKPVALQTDENAFIEKTLLYISSIRGNTKTDLEISTNTRYPTRYVLIVRGVPVLTIDDIHSICDMNERIRSVRVNMTDETLCIDVWRDGKVPPMSKKRKRGTVQETTTLSNWDLNSVDKSDRRCLDMFLRRINAMPNIECQFDVRVDTSIPNTYSLEMYILDSVYIHDLEQVIHSCRSFCSGIEFDFPKRLIRAKCLRVAAPITYKRRKLAIRNA